MQKQNLKNHRQVVYSYYLYTGVPILLLIGLSIWFSIKMGFAGHFQSVMFVLIGWILLTMLFRSRGFALKAQDRAIRAEEGLRYFILTGKRLDNRLSMRQIIALRFASDEEFPLLAKKAVEENLSNKQIKQLIRNWREDTYRV